MTKNLVLLLTASLLIGLGACSRKAPTVTIDEPSHISQAYGPAIEANSPPEAVQVSTPDGSTAEVALHVVGSKPYFAVEGTFRDTTFNSLVSATGVNPATDRAAVLRAELTRILTRLRKVGAISLDQYDDIGYFTFLLPYQSDLMAPLKGLDLKGLTLSPVAIDRESLRQIKSLTPQSEGLVPQAGGARRDTELFSGLRRMNAVEFVRIAEGDIGGGIKINGDSVRLGVTDTGITYNHRTFLSSDRKRNRIVYMRDFTREGRVYFNLASGTRFQTAPGASEEELLITADVIVTPKLPSLPAADEFAKVESAKFLVSPELKAALAAAGDTARLGVLLEDVLSNESEKADINNNGKADDKMFILLIPGQTPAEDRLWVDLSATRDFRAVKPISDWNTSRAMLTAFAEKIGFDLRDDKLPKSDGSGELTVRSASLVGYDPGNHGSHVAGIAAGSRTIFNDREDTLARGVAPDASILMNRVCANNTGCNATQAVIDLAINGGAQVVNMSLGGLSPFNDGYGPQETVLNRLTHVKNVLMIISAGNSGPGAQTIGSPSVARLSLSVGAATSVGMIQRQYQWPASYPVRSPEEDSDFMFFFSSRGPSAAGGFKPNIAAPGTELSSVQLNTMPGARGGLDVYWGTSMAAPAATGAYALLVDAIQKYNAAHPERKLPTSAAILRNVLMESARAFDVNSFDPATGQRRMGQYSWTDQGTGMVDLVAAWKKLQQLASENVPAAVTRNEQPVELDYLVLTALKNPRGQAYDGTTLGRGEPIFGTGLYLDYASPETLYQVHIRRQLPADLASAPDAGDLTGQLLTTMDEFVLKTTIYGSDRVWVRAGALDNADCDGAELANPVIIGRGVEISSDETGKGELNPSVASQIHVCIDRDAVRNHLPPGDHGALIAAYRTADGKVSSVPSFWIPVSLRVPHQQLVGAHGYDVQGKVRSFDVTRNYVAIPQGTSLVRITLEVPAYKEHCSGVELMALQGTNLANAYASRRDARISNCDKQGAPITDPAKRTLTFTASNPQAGMWDIHIFGQYKYAESLYRLRVDYVTADSSVKKIQGGLEALIGSVDWTLNDSSINLVPDSGKSRFKLHGLLASKVAQVSKGQSVIVPGPSGEFRSYPPGARRVKVTTGGSPGNDIDLAILECALKNGSVDPATCNAVATSGGSSDEESAAFVPKPEAVYAIRVDGYEVSGTGEFTCTEELRFSIESGTVQVTGGPQTFTVSYAFSPEQQGTSRLVNSSYFAPGKYDLTGELELRAADETVLYQVPVQITKK